MILIIGYGNLLRGDDSIGQRIARTMEFRLKHENIQIETVYQLTPELVELIRHAHLVVFIDARVGDTPGMIIEEVVEAKIGTNAFTHHVGPATLLEMSQELYQVMPKGVLISIVGVLFDYSGELSPQLKQMLPNLINQVEEIIRAYSRVTI